MPFPHVPVGIQFGAPTDAQMSDCAFRSRHRRDFTGVIWIVRRSARRRGDESYVLLAGTTPERDRGPLARHDAAATETTVMAVMAVAERASAMGKGPCDGGARPLDPRRPRSVNAKKSAVALALESRKG